MTATAKAPQISEAAFTEQILTLAGLKGWRTMHIRPAQNDRGKHRTPVAGHGKGWPDLTLVRLCPVSRHAQQATLDAPGSFEKALAQLRATSVGAPRLIFAELKRNDEYPEPTQREWLADLALIPRAEVYVWRPKDYLDIAEVLT